MTNYIASDPSDQLKIRLRGSLFFYTPRAIIVAEAVDPYVPNVTLIYRGHTYKRKLQTPVGYQKPRAINWRWL